MWIREVDVPTELIDAHRAGRLVIFVGAGASVADPSGLPLFVPLARAIASAARVPIPDDLQDSPDRYLGELRDRNGVDVHHRVADSIGSPASQPNRTHKALVTLACAGPPARIVTTNYDKHLSVEMAKRVPDAPTFRAPALPMGDDFNGLVYLHGCLDQESRHLIVTDRDFGRAYLTDAWAARFLERMFSHHTVLFVGYSHSDVVMTYLARALGPESSRFALTDKPDEPSWRRLGIRPVSYEVRDGSHDALPEALEAWAAWAVMGLLDHRARIEDLVAAPPSQVPEEMSYLEDVLSQEGTVSSFCDLARRVEWLEWVATRPEGQRLFDPTGRGDDGRTQLLAHWVAHWFAVATEELSDAALRTLREAGGRMSRELAFAVGSAIHASDGPRAAWLNRWIPLLIEDIPRGPELLEYLLAGSRWPEDRHVALLLFEDLTEPAASFFPFGYQESPRFELKFKGSAFWLDHAWKHLFLPNIAASAPYLMPVLDRQLRKAYDVIRASGSADETWDPVSSRRAAVSSQPDPAGRARVDDVLINAARDCLEHLIEAEHPLAALYLAAWASAEEPILRRLAIHGWTRRPDVDASAKLTFLLDRRFFHDRRLWPEVIGLVGQEFSSAEPAAAEAVVAAIVAATDGDVHGYAALKWLLDTEPNSELLATSVRRLAADHPDYAAAPRPPTPPITPEQLLKELTDDPDATVARLREEQDGPYEFSRPSPMEVLSEVVDSQPDTGFAILDAGGSESADIIHATIRGWRRSTLSDEMATQVVERINSLDPNENLTDLTDLLADGGSNPSEPTEWYRLPAARSLAQHLWTVAERSESRNQGQDWFAEATNHPAGRLAQFWSRAVAHDWRSADGAWSGLPTEVRDELDRILGTGGTATKMAETFLASQLHFYFGADRGWCEAHLLPLFSWDDPDRATRAWSGFLYWGRPHDALLSAGLLDGYLGAARATERFPQELRSALLNHLSAIAVASEVDPIANGWLGRFVSEATEEDRIAWTDQVSWQLNQMPGGDVDRQWERWMRRYWEDRLSSVPTGLSEAEASALAGWVSHFDKSFKEGVALATSHAAGIPQDSMLLHSLSMEKVQREPEQIERFLSHLLQGTVAPFYDCHRLKEIVQSLRATPTPPSVKGIIEQALRLSCLDATDW